MGVGPAEPLAIVAEDKRQGAQLLSTKEAIAQLPMKPAKVVESIGLKDQGPKTWNTANLGRRLGVDAMSAGIAGGLVAPIICAIDKYVSTSHATGRNDHESNITNLLLQSYNRECIRKASHASFITSILQRSPLSTPPLPHIQALRPHLCPLHRHISDG